MVVVQVEVSAQWGRLMPDPASGKAQKSSECHSPKEPRKGLFEPLVKIFRGNQMAREGALFWLLGE